jgi:hypothetical protein
VHALALQAPRSERQALVTSCIIMVTAVIGTRRLVLLG